MSERARVYFGVMDVFHSEDGTSAKITQAVRPELFAEVETGRYELEGESVVCLSSQVGCAMACSFCKSTGPFLLPGESAPRRLIRNLNASEIVTQVFWALEVKPPPLDSEGKVWSFMGMGEPFANLENVKLATKFLGEIYPDSRATISTIGFNLSGIYELADEIETKSFPIPVKLHISLHGSTDQLRQKLVPYARTIEDTLGGAEYFAAKTETSVKLNYVLVRGVNDGSEDVERLGELLRGREGLILKISDLNSEDPKLVVSKEEADRFEEKVKSLGIKTVRFTSLGRDVEAGCGQLTLHKFLAQN